MNEPISRPAQTVNVDDLAAAFDRRNARSAKLQITNTGFNGSTKFVNGMLVVITSLMVAAVIGMWGMYGKVEALAVEVRDLRGTVDLIVAGKIKP